MSLSRELRARPQRPIPIRVSLVVAGTLVALLAVEIALRVVDTPRPVLSGWRTRDIDPDVDPRELNQLGFRGQRIDYRADDAVVVLVGDSQVEARACAFAWMPERRLEGYLTTPGRRVRVFTLGASAYGQDQELLALREYFARFRADLVVVWETPMNDVWNNVFPTNGPPYANPKPTFWLEGDRLRGPSEEIGAPLGETPWLRVALLWRTTFPVSRDAAWEGRYPPAYRPLDHVDGAVQNDWQQRWNANWRSIRSENLANEKSHLTIFLTPRSPRTQYGLDLTRRLLAEMASLARAHGAPLVAFAVPADPSTIPEDRHLFEGVHTLGGKLYATSRRQLDANVADMNRGVDFRVVPVTVEPWQVSQDDPHLNPDANDQVMHDLADGLAALLPASQRIPGAVGNLRPQR